MHETEQLLGGWFLEMMMLFPGCWVLVLMNFEEEGLGFFNHVRMISV